MIDRRKSVRLVLLVLFFPALLAVALLAGTGLVVEKIGTWFRYACMFPLIGMAVLCGIDVADLERKLEKKP